MLFPEFWLSKERKDELRGQGVYVYSGLFVFFLNAALAVVLLPRCLTLVEQVYAANGNGTVALSHIYKIFYYALCFPLCSVILILLQSRFYLGWRKRERTPVISIKRAIYVSSSFVAAGVLAGVFFILTISEVPASTAHLTETLRNQNFHQEVLLVFEKRKIYVVCLLIVCACVSYLVSYLIFHIRHGKSANT